MSPVKALLCSLAVNLACVQGPPQPAIPVGARRTSPDSALRAAISGRWDVVLRVGRSRAVATSGVIEFSDDLAVSRWSTYGLGGFRWVSLDSFVTKDRRGDLSDALGSESPVVLYAITPTVMEIWLTPGWFDYGFRLRGEWTDGAVHGVVCEDQYSHSCDTRGSFSMTRARASVRPNWRLELAGATTK